MATPLDLEEQEQLDELKHFWKTYGNLISWLLIVVMGAYAAWNGYGYWQRSQSAKERSTRVKSPTTTARSTSSYKAEALAD